MKIVSAHKAAEAMTTCTRVAAAECLPLPSRVVVSVKIDGMRRASCMEKKGENSTKYSEVIAKVREAGLSVTDQTQMGRGVGFIGSVRLCPKEN